MVDEIRVSANPDHHTIELVMYLLISAEIAKRSLVVSLLMDNSLSKEATDWREGRRLRAFELKQQGWSQQRIAEALGVSKGAVSQWMKRVRDGGGAEALKRRPAPGARSRLSAMSSAPRCPSFWNGEPRLMAFEEMCGRASGWLR
jgi:transposase-like protein